MGLFHAAVSLEKRFLLLRRGEDHTRAPLRLAQDLVLAARCYRVDNAGDRAAALAFTSVLSMLPLLLMGLAILGFAGSSPAILAKVQQWLFSNFVPDTARDLQSTLEVSLESLSETASGLGLLGIVLLGMTAWKLVSTLERTFTQLRGGQAVTLFRRLAGLWGTFLVVPLLIGISILVTGFFESLVITLSSDSVAESAGLFLAMVPGWCALFLAYTWCPGTPIPARAAARGALTAALLWELLKFGFALYIRRAFLTKTVLAGLGVLPIFLLWLYLSWVVFVFGAEMALVSEDYERNLRRSGIEPVENQLPS
jgi:membrane protein